ncbi:ABC transporter substrate-binding protein [Sporosarcina sp. FSL W7-1349]|uniref:ABC transporter substrate-binding protein n=1 Tax=Sporosarcina sp. FSL W7-1349 TaxID=2921561 RepID=UPI0030FB36B7
MRNISKWLIGLSLLAIFLVACSKDNSQNENKNNDEANQEANTSEPVAGGEISMPIAADPTFNTWHPNAYAESNIVNRIIFTGLTKPGKDLTPAPALAEKWEASEDGLTWTFHLRENVKWHDGEPFTAEDVVFTFNNLVLDGSMGANGASNYKSLKEVTMVDEHTVEFHLERPWAALPAYLAFNSEIMPKHKLGEGDPWNNTDFNKKNPMGTGPYKIESFLPGQSVILVKNEDFYEGVPNLDKVTYKIVPDANTQIAQAFSKELDYFVLEDMSALKRIESSKDLEVTSADITRYFWIALNHEDERFKDVRVSQAITHAIDRQAIIDSVMQGYGTIAHGPITPDQEVYYTDEVEQYPYDVEKAKQLLAEAGWEDTNGDGIVEKDGKPFTITFDIAIQGDLERIAQLVQQYLIEAGIDVKLNVLEWNAMIQKDIIERDYEMLLNWWSYPTDPDVYAQYSSENAGTGNNIPGYKDPKLDELLSKGQATSDQEERAAIYREVQEYMSETLPYIYLWYPKELQLRNSKLKGLPDMYYGATLHYIHEWYLEN